MGAPGGPQGPAGTGWMTGGSEEAGDISHQTRGFLWCRSGSLSVLSPSAGSARAGPTGLGAAEACLEAGSGASICAASSPAKKCEMALLLRSGGSRSPGGLTECQLPAAGTAALSEQPALALHGGPVKVTNKVGDVSPLCYCCQLSVAERLLGGRGQVGTLLCALPVLWSGSSFARVFGGEQRHAPRLGAGSRDGHACQWLWWPLSP